MGNEPNVEVEFQPGERNKVADWLSRPPNAVNLVANAMEDVGDGAGAGGERGGDAHNPIGVGWEDIVEGEVDLARTLEDMI